MAVGEDVAVAAGLAPVVGSGSAEPSAVGEDDGDEDP